METVTSAAEAAVVEGAVAEVVLAAALVTPQKALLVVAIPEQLTTCVIQTVMEYLILQVREVALNLSRPPIETITSDFRILYNIAVDVTDSCTFGNPFEVLPYDAVFEAGVTDDNYQDLGYLFGAGNSAVGLTVANTESILYNKIARKITFKATKRTVDESTDTCSGTIYCRVRNTIDNKIKYQFGSSINVSSISTSDPDDEITSTQNDNKEPMKVGDMILLEYLDNSAADDKCIKIGHLDKDVEDGVNTYMVYRRSTGYVFSDRDNDVGCVVYT